MVYTICGGAALPPSKREVAARKGCRRECYNDFTTLPQSKIGSEKPIFDSPLYEGAKIAPQRGAISLLPREKVV